jgi:coproporphyrinogen III oxidase-like Fe-S oxidoreductase
VGREILDEPTRETERVLLRTRIREGIDIPSLRAGGRHAVPGLIADGLVDAKTALTGGLTLTRRGRLLADAVVRRLLED